MIMAGGSGSRLWPMSRAATPKQLLPLIVGDDGSPTTLLALSASRLAGLVEPERRSICTGERFRAQVREAAPGILDEMILGEPMGRDTVNAVALAAAAFEKRDPDAVFAVLTADHVIEPNDVFQRCVRTGFELVEDDPRRFVTFAITPTYPATGFGYVERGDVIDGREGAFEVARFVEKPDLARATEYVESGNFGWNAGMFVFHAGAVLDALERFVPESHAGIREIQRAMGTPQARWRETNQSGRPSTMARIRFLPDAGVNDVSSMALSAVSRRPPSPAAPKRMNHCGVLRKITGAFERHE